MSEFKSIITLTQVSDGAPGAPGDGSVVGYYIETNQEEVLRFKNAGGQYTYSPQIVTFKVYNNPKQDNDEQLELNNFSFNLEVQTENGLQKIEKGTEILRLGYSETTIEGEGDDATEVVTDYDLNTVYFNIAIFYEVSEQREVENYQAFRFTYLVDGQIASIKIIQMRNGVSEDMAKLNLHAADIEASIQSNKLSFNANGLSMYKGEERVFGFDNDGDLHLAGKLDAAQGTFAGELFAASGTFTGQLVAASGSFSGSIEAKTGKIGGFTIEENRLSSETTIEGQEPELVLNGKTGEIYAKNITLGNNAKIENQIILSEDIKIKENFEEQENKETLEPQNESQESDQWFIKSQKAYINNPTLHNGIFIEAGKTLLDTKGLLKLGEIEAFGGSEKEISYIKAGSPTSSSYWEINGNGSASFKEITVDKATIKNSVLEIGTVQAVGSLMLFKDSWKIIDKKEKEDGIVYTLETQAKDNEGYYLINLAVGDYILCGDSEPLQVIEVNHNEITLPSRNFNINDVVVKIGEDKDFLISILGDSTDIGKYSTKNSLTLSQFICNETSTNFEKVLVLGDLTGINKKYGTGLFAQNVFLKGSLITEVGKVGESSYAGINTLNGATATVFKTKGKGSQATTSKTKDNDLEEEEKEKFDESKIVFWAGAKGNEDKDIQGAAFQVTENGSIYAYQGIFEGSLITDSIIKGASIHTAKIYGEDANGDAALKIYDAAEGIWFIKSRGEQEEYITLGINNQGIHTEGNKQIISIEEESGGTKIGLISDTIQIGKKGSGTFIKPGSINFNNNIYFQLTTDINNNDKLTFGKIDNNKETDFFILSQSEVTSPQTFSAKKDIIFGIKEKTGSLHYQVIEDKGYDLYVS